MVAPPPSWNEGAQANTGATRDVARDANPEVVDVVDAPQQAGAKASSTAVRPKASASFLQPTAEKSATPYQSMLGPSRSSLASSRHKGASSLSPYAGDSGALTRAPKPSALTLVIPAHPRVAHYQRHFTENSGGRASLRSWVKRSGAYSEMIGGVLRKYALPQELIAVALIESGLDPIAVSPAGATGMWQFMRKTGARYGLHTEGGVDERRIPTLATDAAARHLRDLYESFRDWPLAFAAYNAGEERIRSLCEESGAADFWELLRDSKDLPRETAHYVPKVLAMASIWKEVETYGFVVPPQFDRADTIRIQVPQGVRLLQMAQALGLPLSLLKGLNPGLVGDKVMGEGAGVALLVPQDRGRMAQLLFSDSKEISDKHQRQLLQRVASLGRKFRPEKLLKECVFCQEEKPGNQKKWGDLFSVLATDAKTYRVRRGDSLERLAKTFQVEAEALRRENNLKDPKAMQVGSLLLIPQADVAAPAVVPL